MALATKATERDEFAELSGARKAAILLLALAPDLSARILKKMPRPKVEEVTREIANIDRVTSDVRGRVISEFYNILLARGYVDSGGLARARALLLKTLSPDDAKRVIEALEHQIHQQPFAFLQKTESENLLTFLHGEHPQTIALVLSHLPNSLAAEVLVGLPTDRQVEVVTRIAKMDQTSPEVIRDVEQGLEKRLSGLVAERFERTGGVQAVAEILNVAGRANEKAIMEGLVDKNPELVEDIRRLMFIFEDIVQVDDRGIQAMLKEVENDLLTLALKTASEELKNKIFGNMSERAAALVKEEMSFMGPVRVSDVEGAQQRLVDIVRRLEDAGEVVIAGKGGEKDLVVEEPPLAAVIRREQFAALRSLALADIEQQAGDALRDARRQAETLLQQASVDADGVAQQRREEAFQQGLAEGRSAGEEQVRRETAQRALEEARGRLVNLTTALEKTLDEFERAKHRLLADAETGLVRLALAIARRVCKRTAHAGPDVAAANATQLLELVRHAHDLELRVSPTEYETLRHVVQEFLDAADRREHVSVIADAGVRAGDCSLRSRDGEVNAALDAQLDAIAAVLVGSGAGEDGMGTVERPPSAAVSGIAQDAAEGSRSTRSDP